MRLSAATALEWLGLLRSLAVYRRPGRQRALRRLYADFVGADDLVFDVGAHVGDRSLAFAGLGARVVALEPQPRMARWLRYSLGSNESVEVRAEAVGARPGRESLAISRRTPTVSTMSESWREGVTEANRGFRSVQWDGSVEVPVVTLDELIASYGVPRFCKIDVEGYEAEVLAGLSHAVPGLSIEFVAGRLETAAECVRRLGKLGPYRFNVILGERRDFLFPDWLGERDVLTWLQDGAEGASSGDVYARIGNAHA